MSARIGFAEFVYTLDKACKIVREIGQHAKEHNDPNFVCSNDCGPLLVEKLLAVTQRVGVLETALNQGILNCTTDSIPDFRKGPAKKLVRIPAQMFAFVKAKQPDDVMAGFATVGINLMGLHNDKGMDRAIVPFDLVHLVGWIADSRRSKPTGRSYAELSGDPEADARSSVYRECHKLLRQIPESAASSIYAAILDDLSDLIAILRILAGTLSDEVTSAYGPDRLADRATEITSRIVLHVQPELEEVISELAALP